MKITKLSDLVLSAQAAANKAFHATNTFEGKSIKLEEFRASEFDHNDFDTWESAFNAQLEMLKNFSMQDSPATTIAKKQAAAG